MEKTNAIDRLINQIYEKQNPTVVGLDTHYDILPKGFEILDQNFVQEAADAIYEFNKKLIDALAPIIPAVKVQIAFYEMYGLAGINAYFRTIQYAKKSGLFVMTDAKRGDIGSTAQAYSNAYLGETKIGEKKMTAFESDMLTVNPYFGIDGIKPFIDDCEKFGRGIFILVKTSNPSGGEFQDLLLKDNTPVYEAVAKKVSLWGKELIGQSGYSSVGAVVGATYPQQSVALRKIMKNSFFLVPGYGAQGASAKDIKNCFDEGGNGAIVNSSRAIMCAYKKKPGLDFATAAREEALSMKKELLNVLGGKIQKI